MAALELQHHNHNSIIKELLPPGWGQSRRCDTCRTAAAVLYCRLEAAFFCGGCDCATAGNRHERVVMCEVCEQSPAAVTCKADAAALCAACDADIHSANPLAVRHERVGVSAIPFLDSLSSAAAPPHDSRVLVAADFLCCESDLLDFGFSSDQSVVENGSFGVSDSVVPTESKGDLRFSDDANWLIEKCFDIDFSHPAHQSASSSETGVVPDGHVNLMSEVSYTITNSSGDGVDGGSSGGTGAPARATDREARVLRYREKRKNRKFEKTIRYASRKAYAEKRPRIKGRFAKRRESNKMLETEIETLYGFGSGSNGFLIDHGRYDAVSLFS